MEEVGKSAILVTPIAGRTITSTYASCGSSSRIRTSMGPFTEAMTDVRPWEKEAEPSDRGRKPRDAVLEMVIVFFSLSVIWTRSSSLLLGPPALII